MPDLLAYASNWHDALVLPLDAASEDPWVAPGGVARVMLAVDCPCIVLPRAAQPVFPVDTIAVAWNGSPEAIRALHASAPLLASARRIAMLMGRPKTGPDLRPAFALEAWLGRICARVEYHTLDEDAQDGAGILRSAAGCNAGLLVMGAYGRSRAAEWLLGGVTRHVLEHATLPLLMRH